MICIGCKIDRPESDFYKDKGYSSGFKSRCKTCHIEKSRALKITHWQRYPEPPPPPDPT